MSVFRAKELTYNGKKYVLRPDLTLLQHIERQRISIISLASNLGRGLPQASLMGMVIGIVLRHAGVDFSVDDEERLVAGFMTGDEDVIKEMIILWGEVISAITPEGKKAQAPSED